MHIIQICLFGITSIIILKVSVFQSSEYNSFRERQAIEMLEALEPSQSRIAELIPDVANEVLIILYSRFIHPDFNWKDD